MSREPGPITRRLLAGSPPHGPLVLMYHSVVAGHGTPSWRWAVSMAHFIEQLDLLSALGWVTINFADLHAAKTLPEKAVAITFDDGYANNYAAFEELVRRGMRATWFVVTRDIGRMSGWVDEVPPQPMLSVEQLRNMHAKGMEIGSHTVSHCRLTRASEGVVAEELARSRRDLEQVLGEPVISFAYPYGQHDDAAVSAARKAGYRTACTTRPGWALRDGDPLRIRRISIFAEDSVSTFARKLVFAENNVSWRRVAAYYSHRLASRLHLS